MVQLYDDSLTDLKDPSIRLLVLYPAESPASDVVCSLATYKISELPPYGALSYVWGDPSRREDVIVNGITTSITRNLQSGLTTMRNADDPILLWADALCINQGNLEERSAQVQLMGEIYRKAYTTIIWLGHADEASDTIVELIREIQNSHMEGKPMPNIIKNNERVLALLKFFARPWWVRSWIIQELCLAREPVLILGVMALPWKYFASMMTHIGDEIMRDKKAALDVMLQLVRCEGYVAGRGLKEKREEMDSNDNEITLLDLLVEFRNFATTDRRDKVYAVLGLVTKAEPLIRPDYTIDANEAYTRAARAILKSTRDLTLLESLSMFERFRDPGLPSWVPQWDGEANTENPGDKVPSHIRSVAHRTRAKHDGARPPPLNASKSYYVTRLEFEEPNVLVLDGYIWDDITALGEPLNFPTKIHEEMSQNAWEGSEENERAFKMMAYQGLGHINHVMRDWNYLGLNKRPYPTGQNRKEAFLTTIYGPSADSETSLANYDLAMATHVPQTGIKWGVGKLLEAISKESKMTYEGALSVGITTEANSFECLPNCYGKRLAVTGKDYLALIPKTAAKGDKIALMPGGDNPFLLRADGDKFRVVGTCYVQGIMYGEVWDPKHMHPMRFA